MQFPNTPSPINSVPSGTMTCRRELQFENALAPISFTPEGRLIYSIWEQLPNAPVPIVSRFSGKTISRRLPQPSNAPSGISVSAEFPSNVTELTFDSANASSPRLTRFLPSKEEIPDLAKARDPTSVTSGMLISYKPLQPLNALSPTTGETRLSTVTLPSPPNPSQKSSGIQSI